ncbi:TFCD-C domain-containing protein [Mycena sanguinolenta]|uniref:TFCD-C domain-containing protein n=1 Tax=Mycena sanguinolenta TaxID=230812 RepID=A0A8H7CSY1_9AGAR|nr:TFCD-C domain-containing protein [Mycena sanguinolenta]
MEQEIVEAGRLFATFERQNQNEFVDAQAKLFSLNLTESTTPDQEKQETALFRRLTDIMCYSSWLAYLWIPASSAIRPSTHVPRPPLRAHAALQRLGLGHPALYAPVARLDHLRILFVSTSIQVPTPSIASLPSSWVLARGSAVRGANWGAGWACDSQFQTM